MLLFTILMIIGYTVMLVLSSMSKAMFNKNDEEFSKESAESQIATALLGCGIAVAMLLYSLTNIIYLFNALNVDILKYPTYIMLGLVALNLIRAVIKTIYHKITKSESKTKVTPYSYFIRVVTYSYFIYMLYLLIVGF